MNATIKAFALLAAFGAPMLQAQERQAPSAEQRLDRATAALSLTASQQQQVDALASRYADLQPGDSWRLAADLESILTDEQVESLAEKRARHRARGGERPESGARKEKGRRGEWADRRERGDGRHHEGGRHLDLSEEQREQMKAQRQAARAEHEALREQLQSGALTAEQFTARADALREQARAEFEASLTPEQRQKAEEAEARREAMRAARETVLRITPEQKAALEAARVEAARSAERVAPVEILTEDQRQIVAVHRALAHHGRHGRKGGQGERSGHPERSGRATDTQ